MPSLLTVVTGDPVSAIRAALNDHASKLATAILEGDSRLTDQRVPLDNTVTAAKIAAALKPSGSAADGTEALRALGTVAGTAAAGNDGRLPTSAEKLILAALVGLTIPDDLLPWTVDLDPLAAPATQTNWSTLIKELAGVSATGTTDGTGNVDVSVAHGIGETPTKAVASGQGAYTFDTSINSLGSTNVGAHINSGVGSQSVGADFIVLNAAGPAIKSSGAQNAVIGWDVLLAAGTWTLELLHNKGSDRGIYTVALAGSSIGTIDGYNASLSPKQRSQITGITVAATGKKRLTLTMASKHASSSSYFGHLSGLRLLRTA